MINVYNDRNGYGKANPGCASYTKAPFFPSFILGCEKKGI
jgi:hypothetical protein